MKNHKDLIVWQKAMDLVTEVYQICKQLPKTEMFALSDQLRWAVVSIPSNIAEGQGRTSRKEFLQFLSIARGSKAEVETQLLICVRLKYVNQSEVEKPLQLCSEIGKMQTSLIGKLSGKN